MSINSPAGLLLIDKPAGITSFDIIRRLRRQTGVRKMGHAGTLDPMATGLMLILVGSATKQATHFSGLDKAYEGQVTLGSRSTTGDAEGELSSVSERFPSKNEVQKALKALAGEIDQTPPAYSAIKVGGVRAYKLARQGKPVEMPTRKVTVYRIELTAYDYPVIEFKVSVSSGTYVRSLAEVIGENLGVGAYLSRLTRTKIANYRLDQAHQLDEIAAANLPDFLITI